MINWGRDGGHDKVETFDLQRRQAEQQPGDACGQAGTGQGDEKRPAQFGAQYRRGVSAHGHETRMADGDLTAIASEDIEPVHADDSDAHGGHDGQHAVAQKEGADAKKDKQNRQKTPFQPGVEDGHIFGIIFVKDPGARRHLLKSSLFCSGRRGHSV